MKKKLILSTLQTNYSYPLKEFKPFVETLRKTNFEGDIVLFVNNISKKEEKYLKSKNIKLIKFDFKFPYIKNNKIILEKFSQFKNMKLNLFYIRGILFLSYLLKNKDKYDFVILTDSSDVIFQRNPFEDNFKKDKIYFSLQDNKIKDSIKDSAWIEKAYGKKFLDTIKEENVSCSNPTLGGIKPILKYLKLMVAESMKIFTIDQGNHNYLIYANKIKNKVLLKNKEGIFLICSKSKKENFFLGKDKKIRSKSGKIFSMIHQYDAFPEWSFLYRGICRKSLKEYVKKIPFIGENLIRLKKVFIKSN